jgi:succinoglycan biosynthesis transport protein ExoP
MNRDKIVLRSGGRSALARREDPRFVSKAIPPLDEPFSLTEVTSIVVRRKWIILGGVVTGMMLALAASLMMTPKYQSTSVIEINKENSDALGLESTPATLSDGADTLEHTIAMETHARALQSDTLALQVIDQLHLDARPEFKWAPSLSSSKEERGEVSLPLEKAPHHRESLLRAFHKNLKVKTVSNTRMIEVGYLSPDRQVAADIVNTLANDYLDQYFLSRYTATAQASAWLSKQLADLKMQVEASQQKLVDYQKENGILGTDDANNIVMTRLADLNKQLTEAQGERITRQVINELVKTGNAELISGLAGNSLNTSALNSLNLLQTLRTQEAQLKVQYAQAATKFGPEYPTMVEMSNQINTLNAAIEDEIRKVASRAENDYLTALRTEDLLKASFEKQKTEANNLNDKAIQYTILKHEADSSSNLYNALLEKLQSAGILSGLRSTKLVVIDPGRPAANTIHPDFTLNQGIGLAAGLLLGVALAFTKESMDDTVRNPDRIEAGTLLPQLGIVPDFRSNPSDRAHVQKWTFEGMGTRLSQSFKARESKPLAIAAPDSSMAEAYRQIRSSITLSDDEFPKIFLITSPLSEEGKTTTAINLAAVLARQGAKVLLVDADLRCPAIESRLNIISDTGLSSILSSKDANASAIVEYADQPGLFVLGAGPKPHNPAELLGSKYMAELMALWCSQFDFVVMDASPVLPVTDAVVLSSKVDAVLLVARSERTTTQSLLRTRDMLFRANATIAGFVVNAVDPNSWEYHQYHVPRIRE